MIDLIYLDFLLNPSPRHMHDRVCPNMLAVIDDSRGQPVSPFSLECLLHSSITVRHFPRGLDVEPSLSRD